MINVVGNYVGIVEDEIDDALRIKKRVDFGHHYVLYSKDSVSDQMITE